MIRLHLNEIGDVLIELIGRRERACDHLRFSYKPTDDEVV